MRFTRSTGLFFTLLLIHNLSGQLIGPKNKKDEQRRLYSLSFHIFGGPNQYSGYINHRYWETILNKTDAEGLAFKTNSDYQKSKFSSTFGFFPSLDWRIPISRSSFFKQLEISAGMGIISLKYEDWRQNVVFPNPKFPLNTDSFNVAGTYIRSVGPFGRVSIHSKSFGNLLGFFGGIEWFSGYGTFGRSMEGSKPALGNWVPGPTKSTLHSAGILGGIRLNVSCELNIETYYKLAGYFTNADVIRPSNWASFHNFGIVLRYKLFMNPGSDPGHRTDMFF